MAKHIFYYIAIFTLAILFGDCKPKADQPMDATPEDSVTAPKATTSRSSFGKLEDGTEASLYTLKNTSGTEMTVTDYGGTIVSLKTADKDGAFEDIVLGYDSLSGYLKDNPYFGAIVGRYGNRIAKAKFTLDGKSYVLAANNNGNHLHGGIKSFGKVLWAGDNYVTPDGAVLNLTYISKDMEEGYPGNLEVEVTYTLTNANELKIDYKATTDKKTIINLTNHSYFNLSGNTKRDILGHALTLNASKFLPVDKTLIPTGELKEVKGTPFDFTKETVIGKRINDNDQQIQFGGGYDHCWVADNTGNQSPIATVRDSVSGRFMEVFTTEPGVQFYSGNFLTGSITGKFNTVYQKRYGLCLETQHYPDSPNQPSFPTTVLKPGDIYKSQTVYKFSVK
jgi:aldose 1-epimerase